MPNVCPTVGVRCTYHSIIRRRAALNSDHTLDSYCTEALYTLKHTTINALFTHIHMLDTHTETNASVYTLLFVIYYDIWLVKMCLKSGECTFVLAAVRQIGALRPMVGI